MEIGWSELLVIGVVALVVIGPKDLPEMFRTLGRFTAKLRSMAREFSRAMEDAARETGVKDVADDLRKVASPKSMGLEAVKSAADKFEKWDPLKGTRPGATAPSATVAPVAAASAVPAAAAAPVAQTAAPAPVSASDLAPPVAPAAAPAAPMGPATAALAEKTNLRKGIAAEAAEKLRATRTAEPAAAAEPAPAKRGRTRSTAPKAEAAPPAAAPAPAAAKPARKPATRKTAAKDPQ
ncbi:Sec-independent protein translocase protein TatB [Neotabrizicola sp. VNH66]|uniref:Sec-independent protein translocase protein TatB n=1 Tax=Neotabrizicola sp. VNH66 TaxID=3400918 RepID=UPI003BFCAF50